MSDPDLLIDGAPGARCDSAVKPGARRESAPQAFVDLLAGGSIGTRIIRLR